MRQILPIRTVAASALAVCSLAAAQTAFANTGYTYTDLFVSGINNSVALDVNNLGQVVGLAYPDATPGSSTRGVLWTANKAKVLAPHVVGPSTAGGYSDARSINDVGAIVGGSTDLVANPNIYAIRPTQWQADGNSTVSGTVGGRNGTAWAINEQGVTAGNSQSAQGNQHATVWYGNKTYDLGTLGGATSFARGINESGTVVGYADTASGAPHAAVWTQTPWTGQVAITDLGTPAGGSRSLANSVNDLGQIVGSSSNIGDKGFTAFVWQNGQATLLSGLGGAISGAIDINNHGVIVGRSQIAGSSAFHAVLWDHGAITDLNNFLSDEVKGQGWVLSAARGINEDGWIVGEAVNNTLGLSHGFLLSTSAIPEPATFGLMLAGLTLIRLSTRRAKN